MSKVFGHIYQIKCRINGKIMTGQSINIKQRKSDHFSRLRNNKHPNKYLQEDFNKYGELAFDFEIVDDANDIDDLNKKEVLYNIKSGYPNQEKVYNQSYGGERRCPKIWESSEKTKIKQSKIKTSTGIKGLIKPTKVGSVWRYQYRENKKVKTISNKNLKVLKKMVMDRGLPWEIVDFHLAKKTMEGKVDNNHDEEVKENYELSKSRTTTGIYRVSESNGYYVYRYFIGSMQRTMSSKNICELEKRVLNAKLPWIVVDRRKYDDIINYQNVEEII